MKRNVDLTENRDFSGVGRLIKFNDFHRIHEPEDFNMQIVLTGNAEERSGKRMSLSFCVPDNRCDCCGDTKAWDFFGNSLCKRCEKFFDIKLIWWRTEEVENEFNTRW
jgi:hypothetical protein